MNDSASPARWGRRILAALAAGLLAIGQIVFFCQQAVLPLGLLATLLGLGLWWWLIANPEAHPAAWRAVGLGLVTILYLLGAYVAAFAMRVDGKTTVGFVILGLILFFTVHHPLVRSQSREQIPDAGSVSRQWFMFLGLTLLVLAAMAAVIALSKAYLGFYDLSVDRTDFFRLRAVVGGAYDIASGPFKAWSKLWVCFFFLIALMGVHGVVLVRLQKLRPWVLWLILFGLGNLGALTIAYLAFQGLKILPVQVLSENYNFYKVASSIGGFKDLLHFVENIVELEMKYMKLHTCTHPPGGIVLNWILHHVTGGNATLVALILGALTWTGVIPMYLAGRELYNREFGYYAAALYAALPNMLIFSYVSLDALAATLLAWTVAMMIIASRREQHVWMLAAGLMTLVTAMFTFTTLAFMPALFAIAVMGLRDQGLWQRGPGVWMKAALIKCGWFVLALAVPYLLLQIIFHWHFEYPRMLQNALAQFASPIQTRPWFIWFWLSPMQYFIHVGAAVTALVLWRWRDILRGAWRNDFLPWAGLITLLTVIMNATVHNEADRLYVVYNVFIVLTASMALFQQPVRLRYMEKPQASGTVAEVGGGSRLLFLTALALAYINAVVIQILVVDYW